MEVTLESILVEVANLRAAVNELLSRTPARASVEPALVVTPTATYDRFPGGPRIIEVAPNIRVMAEAPINPAWVPPFYVGILGRDFDADPSNGAPYAYEPSNAGPGRPCRTADGYPLHYWPDGTVSVRDGERLVPAAEWPAGR